MAIIGIPSTRISDQFVRQVLLSQVQTDQIDLFRLQTQLSTGRQFELPSEAPVAAGRVMSLQRLLERKEQIKGNLSTSQSYLSATDTAMSQISGLMAEVRGTALSVIGTTASDVQRQAAAQQVAEALRQLVDAGNQNFRGRYLFAGSQTTTRPFTLPEQGNLVRYEGNQQHLASYGNVDLLFDTNVQGDEAFGAISDPVRGSVDLNPVVTRDTRLADLRGGQGIHKGNIAISDGSSTQIVDLSQAETVGDLVALIHAHPPAGNSIDLEIIPTGFVLQLASGNLTINEVGGGTTAAELGILTKTGVGTNPVYSADLDPILRPTTALADLLGTRATAVLRPGGPQNDIIFRAGANGEALNGVTISLVDDPAVHAGSETVDWDPVAKTLVIHIEDNYTEARDVVKAVNDAFDAGLIPFQAEVDPLDGSGGTGLISSATTPPVVTAYGSGTDLDQGNGLQIVNGGPSPYTIDISDAATVEDLLNILNTSPAGVLAEINAEKTGIDVRSRLSGADFAIGENGGITAAQLGLRTFTQETKLADLNFGRGVMDYQGPAQGVFPPDADFMITRNDGVSFTIDVHGARSIGDVLDLINNNPINSDPALGVPLEARLAVQGNGIELVDFSTGPDHLTVTRNPMSTAAIDLGLIPKGQDSNTAPTSGADPDLLTGADVGPKETDGLFTALIRLQHALLTNDLGEMQRSVDMLDRRMVDFNFARAELGARQQGLDTLQQRLDSEEIELRQAMSLEYDVDMADVVSQLSAKQIGYEASLRVIALISQMSLLNYL
jgi:flagellin-like hook-associated protein FlgL